MDVLEFGCRAVVTCIDCNLRTSYDLQELGINAIELMPSHEFNELEYHAYNPVMDDYKYDYKLSACLGLRHLIVVDSNVKIILCFQNALETLSLFLLCEEFEHSMNSYL